MQRNSTERLFDAMTDANLTQAKVAGVVLSGKKFDTEKPDLSLIPPEALNEVAIVLGFGKKKYGAHNWRGGFDYTRLSSGVLRHVFAWVGGKDTDPESGRPHLAHAICGLMFLLTLILTKSGKDDRYKGSQNEL